MYEGVDERLKVIAEGSRKVAVMAQDRLAAAIGALLDGDFDAAEDRVVEALAKVQALARSQRDLGTYGADHDVVRAQEVEEGAVIVGWGTLTSKEVIDEPGHMPGVMLTFTRPDGEEGRQVVQPWRELVIKAP